MTKHDDSMYLILKHSSKLAGGIYIQNKIIKKDSKSNLFFFHKNTRHATECTRECKYDPTGTMKIRNPQHMDNHCNYIRHR